MCPTGCPRAGRPRSTRTPRAADRRPRAPRRSRIGRHRRRSRRPRRAGRHGGGHRSARWGTSLFLMPVESLRSCED
ncbi:hypothetical protein CDOO_10620 [Corynebacterium doosanense CAU 212 = DSM 45436]|uniref:Uncharacterized protein n=1 Tax=Corynebacterium doosanense CAU 212 = DSM 45436 TaxID=558173 RepID=A0A097IHP8_9CORY|nr:hypothetical protein CDOO_10620 [Corynebacterium doosanense CAU 212 = DSM 45436]